MPKPRISFDEKGECNACTWSKLKKLIGIKRKTQLKKILDIKKNKKSDFIV